MRSLYLTILAICAAVVVACGSGYVPPESARTPDGAIKAPPPVTRSISSLHIDTAGLHLIESFEGYTRCAFFDTFGGVWTAGFGQTRGIHQGFCFSGRSAAEVNLASSVEREYQWAVRGLGVAFNQNQIDALDSFAYNLGAGIFTGSLRFDLQHRLFWSAAQIMLQYDHAGGVVLAGLARRRHEEVTLFLRAVPIAHPSRSAIEHRILAVRRLLQEHRCRVIHGPHAYHACPHWAHEGRVLHHELGR